MATLGSKLITKQMEINSNMTEQSHLGKALIAKPAIFSEKMDQIFSSKNYYSDNPLTSTLLNTKTAKKTITNTGWEWSLKGANTRPLVIMENVEPSTNTTLGKYGRTFKIKLDQNWYLPGDVLCPGLGDKKYQCRIQDSVQKHGDGWVYTMLLMDSNKQSFLPSKFLEPGTQWGKLYSVYEEAAEQSGSTQFSLPFTLHNWTGKARKQYKITDYASTEVLATAIPDSKGNYHTFWMRYADVEFWMQWYREIERLAWYSRSTTTVPGANGRPVRSFPGVQEQLEDSHIRRYTHFTTKLLEDFLMDIFYSRVKPSANRSIKLFTGEYGMIQFNRAVQDSIDKGGFVKNIEQYESGVKSEYHINALQYGYQYVKANLANGIQVEVIHNPIYDDREINSEIDPITGYPTESLRYTCLDFSGSSKESNVQIVEKENGMAFAYIEGLFGPYGPKNGGNASHSGAYYEMHVDKTFGIHINDITKCGELILNRN